MATHLILLGGGILMIWLGGRAIYIARRDGYVMVSFLIGSEETKLYRADNPKLFRNNLISQYVLVILGLAALTEFTLGVLGLQKM